MRRGDTFPGLTPTTCGSPSAIRDLPRVRRRPRWDPCRRTRGRGDLLSTYFAGTLLADTIAAVVPRDAAAERAARERLDRMTKPPGSLGVLEDVAAQLAGI